MAVVTSGGLVGRITAVSPLTAQVDSITKDKAGLGGVIGELGKSNALGVLRGTGKKELLEMDYVPGSVEVNVGEIVYTTGQDGIFPAGLKLGEVVEVTSGSATVPHKIMVRPSANLYSMQEVGVLLYEPPPRPEYQTSLPNAVKDEKKK
jgi:rod shape-determining protein MreC